MEGNETGSVVAVSFAAAALLLFLDLRMPGINEANRFRLAEHICGLAGIVRKLNRSLNANAGNLEKLLAFRAQHRPSEPGRRAYDALVAYRMGEDPAEVAKALGMTPYKSTGTATSPGSRARPRSPTTPTTG